MGNAFMQAIKILFQSFLASVQDFYTIVKNFQNTAP